DFRKKSSERDNSKTQVDDQESCLNHLKTECENSPSHSENCRSHSDSSPSQLDDSPSHSDSCRSQLENSPSDFDNCRTDLESIKSDISNHLPGFSNQMTHKINNSSQSVDIKSDFDGRVPVVLMSFCGLSQKSCEE